jgi:Domain of unknown function DUF29
LRAKEGPALDVDNLAEETESSGKRDRWAVESYPEVRLRHGLKWVYQPAPRSPSWRRTLTITRQRLARVLRDSPSLRAQLPVLLPAVYSDARAVAATETGLPPATLPELCPWPVDQVLDEGFLPEALEEV